ncbi:hypothetical protein BG015_011143 [Linnemannia schmuckeri]|uniref:Cation-transporting ATPase n=1 Tax=Linnemannia schmuckeri TaxID=64567 RepID=A0A9P5RVJ6_9FUNG|nr:hypothetical protein BG015_011143 [Linnemannia schmuckeri]
MNNTNPPQRPLSSTSLAASNDYPPHRKQASFSANHRRSSSNPNNLDAIEYVVGNNSSTSLSNNFNNNKRRSSLLPPLHESSSTASSPGNNNSSNNNGNRNDPDYSSPSLPFSPYTPPTILSQRFNHESDNEDENNDSYDDDPDDSDRTEGSEITPSMAKATAAVSSSGRPKALKRPTYDHRHDRCHQRVYLEEEDVELIFTGYRFRKHRLYLYYVFCALSFGIIFLLGRWMPRHYIAFVAQKCEMNHAEFIVVQNEWGQLAMESVFTKYYGGPIDSVFSPEQMEKPEDDESYDETVTTGMLHDMRYFDYQYIRFIYNPSAQAFMQNSQWKDSDWNMVANCERGIGRETHQERTMVFGHNLIDVQEKTIGQLLVQEVLHPFYVFQVFSMALWFADDYYYYAACIFVISTVSVVTELVETKKTMKRMRNMSRFTCNTKVFRSGRWRYIGSEELVPGDVFEVTDSDLTVFPCDAVLLTGDCIVNESMLTGESVPVSKIPVTDAALQHMDLSLANIPTEIARHFLFSGTKIVRARPGVAKQPAAIDAADEEYGTSPPMRGLAMVVRIGFNTTKGTLIRSMLFPKPNDFQFYRDSFRFIGILAMIACFGFLISTVNFVRMGVPFKAMIVKALDLITIVVPPALPATMSIGTSFAIARLKRSNIFCISPTRVNIGGKINCMCFDKTGTLTEDGLDVLGVQCPDSETGKFSEMLSNVDEMHHAPASVLEKSMALLFAMTTCHSVKSLNGELIGDPLDLKMFEFTQWTLEEGGLGARTASVSESAQSGSGGNGIVSTVVRPPGGKQFNLDDMIAKHNNTSQISDANEGGAFLELGIIRCFEFVSQLRRMSVIVKRLHSPGMDIFVKGAPEVMTDICIKGSLPQDYQERLSYYTHHGYRVIACAYKAMPALNFIRAQRLKREQAEADLTFLGFIVFENKLKPTTAPIIATLGNARIRQVMCTGDNVLTAISVSRECGLINKAREVYTPRFVSGDSVTETSEIVWENIDNERMILDPVTLKPATTWSDGSSHGPEFPRYSHMMNDYVLAVTGDCFRWMVDYASTSTLNRMLVKGQIFARMSPDEKHELVEHLQAIGYCVGFCGDGANDCGALKAADVGISLSEAEASVAAPFTSRSNDIGCVVKVIQEGRAALVTSFSCFKYMALYSIIQFTTVSFLYAFASNLGDFQFLYIDLVLILPIAVFMGRTQAYPVLSPKRPTANLVSKKVLTSLIGQILIQSLFQGCLFVIVRHQPWYTPPDYDPAEKNIDCIENTVLFLLSCFQYLLVAIVFSVGPPYRKPMSSNRPFVLITVTLVLTSAIMVLFPTAWITDLMQLVHIPFSFRVLIVVMAGLNLAMSLVCEGWVFPKFAKLMGEWWGSRKAKKEARYQHEQQVFAPPPQQSVGGYGSQNLTERTAQQAQSVGIDVPVESGAGDAGVVASSSPPKKTLKKKSSVKIYKMVEDEMMGA